MFTRVQQVTFPRFAGLAPLLALLVAVALLFGAQPASAHDELLDATPADGATLEVAPEQAQLTFSGEVQQLGTQFELQDAGGAAVELPGDFTLDGTRVTQPLPELAAGAYQLNWRVVSEDGHPVSGTISFTIGAPAGAAPVANDGGQQVSASAGTVGAVNPWLIVGLSVLGLLVLAGVAIVMIGKLRRGNTPFTS